MRLCAKRSPMRRFAACVNAQLTFAKTTSYRVRARFLFSTAITARNGTACRDLVAKNECHLGDCGRMDVEDAVGMQLWR